MTFKVTFAGCTVNIVYGRVKVTTWTCLNVNNTYSRGLSANRLWTQVIAVHPSHAA